MRRTFLLPLLLSACGLTAQGKLVDGGADAGDAIDASADAPVANDAGADVIVEDADAAPCVVEVNDAFATAMFDPAIWTTVANAANAGFPKPVVAGSASTASFIDDQKDSALGGIWHTAVVPFDAFDIAFDAYAVCSTNSCGDGLAIAWLEAGTTAQLNDAQPGNWLGLPKTLSGGAVALDLAQNGSFGETVEPAMTILDIDKTKTSGAYDWVVASSDDLPMLKNNGARRIDLKMRAKNVSVKVDGVEVATGTMPRLPTEGIFGFTGASGSYNARLAVGDVRAKFYRCNAP